MKNFFRECFGLLGLVIYYPIAFVVRIPVFVFLLLAVALVVLIWNPITGKDSTSRWIGRLYDWYCGE